MTSQLLQLDALTRQLSSRITIAFGPLRLIPDRIFLGFLELSKLCSPR